MIEGENLSQTGIDAALAGFVGLKPTKQTNKKKAKRNMESTIKTITYLQMTALFLTAALPGAVAAEKEVPFRGTLQAVETHVVQFPTLLVAGSGKGNATQLGKFTMTFDAEVNLSTRVGIGSSEFIVANGDRVFADFVGQSTLTGTPNLISIVEIYTITGGTGRFADATGSFLLERLEDQVTGSSSGSFVGTIVMP